MANFDSAYTRTLGFEGKVLEDVSGDPGGETFYGIARKYHPNWPGWNAIDVYKRQAGGDAQKLKALLGTDRQLPAEVKRFYVENFWSVLNLSDAESQAVAEEIFDTAVNCSTQQAAKMLQRALNVLNKQGTLWADVAVDGKIGKGTIAAMNTCTRNPDYGAQLFKLLNALQAAYYCEITERNPGLEKFMYGWLKQRVQS